MLDALNSLGSLYQICPACVSAQKTRWSDDHQWRHCPAIEHRQKWLSHVWRERQGRCIVRQL